MKPVSTSGVRSRGRRSPERNIRLVRRELIPGSSRSSWLWGFCGKFAQMLLMTLGLCLFFVTGFSLEVNGLLLYGVIALLCLLFTVFFYDNWLTGARIPGAMALALAVTLAVLFSQNQMLSGFSQLGGAILTRMHENYGGDYILPQTVADPQALSIFFLLIFVPITAGFGVFTVYRSDAMVVSLLLLPLLGLGLLAGAAPAYISPIFLGLGILSVAASGRVGWQKSLWGQKDTPLWEQNRKRQKKISALSALSLCVASCILMIPSFWILMPSLSAPINQAAPLTQQVENFFAENLLKGLTDFSGSGMSAPISVFGGGVADGSLSDHTGYLISDVEDLRLKMNQKPEETLYLRGFVGGSYTKNQWHTPQERVFQTAAGNWETDGDASLYLYNLPFLRMLYEETEADGPAGAQLTVERLNANDAYTYTPYGSYLNEYYQIQGGDGAVTGQKVQDDIFLFYSRADQQQTLKEEYFLQNESSLDRLERVYAAYAQEHYTNVPEGFQSLQAVCDGAGLEDAELATLVAFVQQYLRENYTYSLSLPDIPKEADAVAYFLHSSRVGCSPQFASAATVMFRCLGVPARYVVGYAASKSLFTPQPDGTYQAILQSDNAHAWTEIYISGTVWMPIETTPGQLGLVQDMEYWGSDLTPEVSLPEPPATDPAPAQKEETPQRNNGWWVWAILAVLGLGLLGLALWLTHKWMENNGLNRRLPPERRLRLIFAAYFRRLRRAGLPEAVDSCSPAFPGWVKKLDSGLTEEEVQAMVSLVLDSCFGNRRIRETDVVWMRARYRAARRSLRKVKHKAA